MSSESREERKLHYIENPKTKGSGILCAIPQKGTCPNACEDCFFQSGRSYLEPLAENLPNMPNIGLRFGRVVRVNDGNDSNVEKEKVIDATSCYEHRFFNTAIPDLQFPGPVVLTVNPGDKTDHAFYRVEPTPNLMFVRVRVNLWNLDSVVRPAVQYYTMKKTLKDAVPVVLTFMAYFKAANVIPDEHRIDYTFRKRTLNSYWAIEHAAWLGVMDEFVRNPLVHSCGTEGVEGGTKCLNCGNCLREYHATVERMRG